MLKATVGLIGVDTYYIPDDWYDVSSAYMVPGTMNQREIWRMRKKKELFLQKYKTDFVILSCDPKDKLDMTQIQKFHSRKVKVKPQKTSFYLVLSVIEKPKIVGGIAPKVNFSHTDDGTIKLKN